MGCDRLILHSDNGGPMKGQNMLFKMASLALSLHIADLTRVMTKPLQSHCLPL